MKVKRKQIRAILQQELDHLELMPVNAFNSDLMRIANPERYNILKQHILSRLQALDKPGVDEPVSKVHT
jgi:hypothetical protein